MALLDDALDACGGLERWRRLKRFTVHLSIDGALFSRIGNAGRLKDMVMEGSTEVQTLQFTGFTAPDRCGLFQPDWVAIQSLQGEILRSCGDPQTAFSDHHEEMPWDDLRLAYFCGLSLWNCLTTPFLLAQPEIETEELPPWNTGGQIWRRLRALFPPTIVTHSREQIFYFDSDGLQRRLDYEAVGTPIAHLTWAHQKFNDIVIPTLRRCLSRQPGGTLVTKPALIDIEIFDASFE
ncbi:MULTISPECIES: hypothetical protein [unclassified Bradyrhizobium]